MAWTPKVAPAIAELKHSGILSEDRFYRMVSEQNNYMDPASTRAFYQAMYNHVNNELRLHGAVRLPMMGNMYLLKRRDGTGWNGNHMAFIKDKYILRLDPAEKWKKYWHTLAAGGALLDPREKLDMMPKPMEAPPSNFIFDPTQGYE